MFVAAMEVKSAQSDYGCKAASEEAAEQATTAARLAHSHCVLVTYSAVATPIKEILHRLNYIVNTHSKPVAQVWNMLNKH